MTIFSHYNPNQQKKYALAALTTSSVIWGINSPVMKLALLVTPLFLLAFLRFFIASFVMLLFQPSLKVKKGDIPLIVLCALLGVTFNIIFFFYGLKLSSAINAGMIIATIPIFTLIGAALFLKEKVKSNLIAAAVLGVIGVGIIIFEPLIHGEFSDSVVGNIFLVLAAIAWVGYEIVSKKLFKTYSPATVTYYSFLIGGITFLPFAATHIFTVLPTILFNPKFLVGVGYGIFLTSALSYFLWQWGLSKLEVSRVGFFFYLDPIVGTIASVLILGESITFYFIVGALLIFAGLYLAEMKLPYHNWRKNSAKNPQV